MNKRRTKNWDLIFLLAALIRVERIVCIADFVYLYNINCFSYFACRFHLSYFNCMYSFILLWLVYSYPQNIFFFFFFNAVENLSDDVDCVLNCDSKSASFSSAIADSYLHLPIVVRERQHIHCSKGFFFFFFIVQLHTVFDLFNLAAW